MYLSDKDIRLKLADLNFECSETGQLFNPDEQIQPCSIDLRLDNVFWQSKKVKSFDLRKSKLLELSPRLYWKKIVIRPDDYITIEPGEMLLGRIYEKFTIPNDCAGKIEGRSSFSRMGLGIHIGSDFINPAWRGHMPLQIVNYNKNAIRIFPFIHICQMMLIKLTSIPERLYGIQELQSKYMDDDGGPSYWWRDKRIKRLQDVFTQKHLSIQIQEKVFEKIGVQEPDIIERFENFISKKSSEDISNVEVALTEFLRTEKRLERKDQFMIRGIQVFFTIATSFSIASIKFCVDNNKVFLWCIPLYLLNAVLLFFFIKSFYNKSKKYLTQDDLEKNNPV